MRLDVRTASVVALLIIGLAGAAAVAFAIDRTPQPDSFWIELAKTGLQVVAVAFLGSGAAIAVFSYQERTRQIAENLRRENEAAGKQREREHEEMRRDEDRRRDERERLDDLRREALEVSVRSYNKIKSTRRHLRAALRPPNESLDADRYETLLADLIEQQLQFEELKRLSPALGDPSLREELRSIERAVGVVTTEYESRRQAGGLQLTLEQLPRLRDFLRPELFHQTVAVHLNAVTERLHTKLLEPFDIQGPPGADRGLTTRST